MEYTALNLALGTLALALVAPLVLFPTRTLHQLRRKRYQYEVTFGLYMMTPTEKFILNTFLILTFSTLTLATVLYLPSHISTISHRALYYYSGSSLAAHGHAALAHPLASITDGVALVNQALHGSFGVAEPVAAARAEPVAAAAESIEEAQPKGDETWSQRLGSEPQPVAV